MKFLKQLIFMSLFSTVFGAQAADTELNQQTVYSAAGITVGANSTVHGNVQAVAAATLGADAEVSGDLVSGAAITLGANGKVGENLSARDAGTIGADATIGGNLTTGDAATLGATTSGDNVMVGGDLTAGAAILVGVKSQIGGDLTSGAAASADLGASATVGGSARAGTALTLGADAQVGTDLEPGNVQAGSGAVALGVDALVTGNAKAGTIIAVPSGAEVRGTQDPNSPEQFTNPPKDPVDNNNQQVAQKQQDLRDTDAPDTIELAASQAVSRDLESGVYHATALTTTAGISLTFKGTGMQEHWLINVDTFINFGANLTMVLDELVHPDSTITFNAGGYTAIGADSNLIGTIFAGTYITTGASTKLSGIDDDCGGLFTANGAITLGAGNTIGSNGCTQSAVIGNGGPVDENPGNTNNKAGPVNLGTAGDFVILAKTGVSTTGTTDITGDVGVSPYALTSITGFGVVLDSTNTFATSSLVKGQVFSADMAAPTPAKMTMAISDMETAYTDAAGRKLPDATELGAGDISSMTLAAGLYKWSTNVLINKNVTLAGSASDVWIFQISGDLIQASATSVLLTGGALAKNVFWQVGGGAGVELGTTADFAGIVLAQKAIVVRTGAKVNGRLLGQTAVTLDANMVTPPAQ